MFFHESPSFPLSLVGRSAFAVSTHLFVICETGSKGGTVVRALASYQCGPGSNPGVDAICGLSLLLVLSQCSERFFSGYSGFPPSSETNISKFQFDQESDEEPLCGCATCKSLFIYLFYSFHLSGSS